MTRFVHLTDLHVSHPEAADAGQIPDTPGALRNAIDVVNAMNPQPEFVVASGDLTNLGDEDSYRLLADILGSLNAPLVTALGNHDKREGFNAVFGDGASDTPLQHDCVLGGLHIIVLDTLVPGHVAGRIGADAFDFLETALVRQNDLPKLLVMHHPPQVSPDGLPWATIDADSTEKLAQILNTHHIAGILSGHIHVNRICHWNGIPVITNIGLNSTVDMLETSDLRIVEGTAMGLCEWRDNGLSVSFAPLTPVAKELGRIDRKRLEAFR